ncbi:ATP-binding protein [Bremerella sp. T1]|uniref:AAA family ATPase n=1 Tax=Bremerella sp. TYQ1 TaxID=3119568 RepID=UPI001CC9BE00|nr:AAA family ATPase [Bremerella volcania]UBM37398.1 AAA family ATPase [Bremerella volcania]
MSDPLKDLLSQLSGQSSTENGDIDPWQLVEAISPEEEPQSQEDKSLEAMISRINSMTSKGSDDEGAFAEPEQVPEETATYEDDFQEDNDTPFYPREPGTLREASLTSSDVEALCIKYLLTAGEASGREIANQICIPFLLMDECLRKMKYDQLVVYKDTAQAGDYVYYLTDLGRERARRYNEHCTYYGAAPVSLKDYIASVRAQSLEGQSPSIEALETAFEDLLINKSMFRRLGPAINSGRGLFLYGAPGNGKTSIAERVTRSFGKHIWVPRAIGIDGEILRVFDPAVHDEVPIEEGPGIMQEHRIDRRWVRIKRPTIVVGGELTMDNLEISTIQSTGVSEAPLQLKSNCGTLVIDDFGRQRMSTDELLNRWIVPLEKRYDFLNMRGGKKIQVPFDQLIVFSTNLEPRDLCDDAFLRRIPYKIEVVDPTEQEFRQLFDIMCPMMGFTVNETAIDYLIENHYKKVNRPFRCCQPRDLLMQVRNMCLYENAPLELTNEYFDDAVDNYFAVM